MGSVDWIGGKGKGFKGGGVITVEEEEGKDEFWLAGIREPAVGGTGL